MRDFQWSEIKHGADEEIPIQPDRFRDRNVSLPNKLNKRKQSEMANHNYPNIDNDSINIRKKR